MHTAPNLRREEAEWLMILSRGHVRKTPFELGMPQVVVESLLRKGLVVRRGCYIEITTYGMADALRLSVPDPANLDFICPSCFAGSYRSVSP